MDTNLILPPVADASAWLNDLVKAQQATSDADATFDEMAGVGDLNTAPGVGDGRRHDTLLRLVGSALGRGVDPWDVLEQAYRFGERCRPPMDRAEVFKAVRDTARKESAKLDPGPAVQDAPFPEPDRAALYGLAGEIVTAIEPETEADPMAVLLQLLVYFGCAIGRSAHFLVESTKHYCNLFVVLVGQTAIGRKGTSEGRVRDQFRQVDPDWAAKRILNGLSSGEGLIWAVRDPIEKKDPVKEKGKVVRYETVLADHGIDDKRLLVVEPEFASVLRQSARDGNTLSATIRAAWDSGDLRVLTKNSPARSTGALISIIGHITGEELASSMPETEGFNGFANRFLWACVRRSKLLPEGGRAVDLSDQVARLTAAVDFARTVGRMTRDEAATKLWADLYAELSRPRPGLLGGVTSRATAQVLRLSMIYALLDRAAVVRSEHLTAARALWLYADDSAAHIFGNSTGDPLADKILAIIRERPSTRKDIHDATNRHFKAAELERALAKLKRLRLIRSESVATGGRPAERWSVVT